MNTIEENKFILSIDEKQIKDNIIDKNQFDNKLDKNKYENILLTLAENTYSDQRVNKLSNW